eukprot:scaffold25378_cov180-Amphora_coffeaeformis.AAC.2
MESNHLEKDFGRIARTNGHSCALHKVCGKHVGVVDVLQLVPCVVSIDEGIQDAKAWRWSEYLQHRVCAKGVFQVEKDQGPIKQTCTGC